jgi:hypothetical protein
MSYLALFSTVNRELAKISGTMNKQPRGIWYEDLPNQLLVKMSTIQPIIEPMLTKYTKRATPIPRGGDLGASAVQAFEK